MPTRGGIDLNNLPDGLQYMLDIRLLPTDVEIVEGPHGVIVRRKEESKVAVRSSFVMEFFTSSTMASSTTPSAARYQSKDRCAKSRKTVTGHLISPIICSVTFFAFAPCSLVQPLTLNH